MRPTPPPLPYRLRADLFTHLAVMEKSGLPALKAFDLLRLPPAGQERLLAMRRMLAKGSDPATAGLRSHLFSHAEAAMVKAALQAGSPAATYQRLADSHGAKASQLAAIKSRSLLPAVMLLVALSVAPLPELVSGRIGAGGYLWLILRPLIVLGGVVLAGRWAINWFRSGTPSPARAAVDSVLLQLPLFGPMHARAVRRDFIESLAMQLEAGLPVFEALPLSLPTANNSILRAQFARLLPMLKEGTTLAQAFTSLGVAQLQDLTDMVKTGEASGTLPDMLFRFVRQESEAINLFQQQVADWVPRIFYAGVAVWMATRILSGQPTMPMP
jgi:general secretion pathway protein F